MPYVVTHILIAVILIELFRKYFVKNNRKFPRYYILIVALGAILPDFDIAVYYVLYFFGFSFEQVHKTFLHTIFIPLILLITGLIILGFGVKHSVFRKRHMNLYTILLILSAGSFLHIILDVIFSEGVAPFYPFVTKLIGLNLIRIFPLEMRELILPTLDGIMFILWLFWMQFKLKIDDYF